MHVGSQLSQLDTYSHGLARLLQLLESLHASGVDTLRYLDVGGGLAVSYRDEIPPDLAEFGRIVRGAADTEPSGDHRGAGPVPRGARGRAAHARALPQAQRRAGDRGHRRRHDRAAAPVALPGVSSHRAGGRPAPAPFAWTSWARSARAGISWRSTATCRTCRPGDLLAVHTVRRIRLRRCRPTTTARRGPWKCSWTAIASRWRPSARRTTISCGRERATLDWRSSLMRVGLMADTHDRLPAIDALVREMMARGVGLVLHAGDYCSPFALRPFADHNVALAGVFGRNDGDHEGLNACRVGARHRALRVAAQPRSRRAEHPAGARYRRGAAAFHRGTLDRGARLYPPQEMKTRGDALVVNPGEGCGWLYGAPSAAVLDLETKQGAILHTAGSRNAVTDPTSGSRILIIDFRLAVHTADRAARARGARLLGDPSADGDDRLDPCLASHGHHPQRRPELRVRRGRARRRIASSSTSRRSLASATA